jgi:hypothetical protein
MTKYIQTGPAPLHEFKQPVRNIWKRNVWEITSIDKRNQCYFNGIQYKENRVSISLENFAIEMDFMLYLLQDKFLRNRGLLEE